MMIETRKDMQETVHEVNQQRNTILHFPQLDMIQFQSMWLFGIFSACLPVLKCVEDSSTIKEPELQENLIRGTHNFMLAPPQFPLMVITDDNASTTLTEMQAFSNETNIKNHIDLEETNSETPQVEQQASESGTPKKYIAGQPHLYKIERIPLNPSQSFASSSSGSTSENLTPMRWTPELHDHFVEAINQLGGSRKGRFETKSSQTEEAPSLRVAIDDTGDIDINEALKIQMEVQKQLHEHLEMQRKLQMRIQEQGKHLKKMIEQQQHATIDQSHALSLSPFSSNSYDDCIKERADQTRDYDKHDNMLQH